MENKALYDFINDACKQDDSNLDISIATLQSAIGTLQKEVEKRKHQKKQYLINNFRDAYQALAKANIKIKYDFDVCYVADAIEYSDCAVLELDDASCFIFG